MARIGPELRADDGRLRVGVRIAVVVVVLAVATGVAPAVGALFDYPLMTAVGGIAMAAVGIGLFVLLARRMDRRDPVSYGLRFDRAWWRDVGAGAAIGMVLPALGLGLLLAGGWAEIVDVWTPGMSGAVWSGLAAGLVYYTAVAIWEELVFRGHLMTNAAEALADRRTPRRAVLGAVLISIPIFAAGHVEQFFAYGVPPALSLWWWVAAGALLGLAYAYTGSLALPMGIHLTMNYAGNYIFGLPGAEITEPVATVLTVEITGPGWIAGVGGVVWLLATVPLFGLLWLWLRLRDPGASEVHEEIATLREPASMGDETDDDAGVTGDDRVEVTGR